MIDYYVEMLSSWDLLCRNRKLRQSHKTCAVLVSLGALPWSCDHDKTSLLVTERPYGAQQSPPADSWLTPESRNT